jgi:hypothetical protein
MSNVPTSTTDRGEGFCPECGQSLQLTRHPTDVPKRRTAEPWLVAIVGLCLAVVFGTRTWQARDALADLDRQIAVGRTALTHDVFGASSKRAMAQAEAVTALQTDRASLQQRSARDRTGLGLGLIGLVAGVGAPIRSAQGLTVRRWRGHAGTDGPPSPRNAPGQIAASLGAMGSDLASSLFRVLLIVFGGSVAGQLIRGVPLTLDVVDQALGRTIEIVTAVGGMLG